MDMKFSAVVREKLADAGLSGASYISGVAQPSGFRDSQSIWELGNLRFRFIKERGQYFVDIGSRFNESHYFIFDDVALLMKWQTVDDLVNVDSPLELQDALRLIRDDLAELDVLFSREKITETAMRLDEISKLKAQALFGYAAE